MKSLIITSLLFLFSISAVGQSQDSSAQRHEQQKKQKMDRFIDEDGDGISDKRSEGLGFRRKGSQNQHGLKKQGKMGASGTNATQQTGKGNQYRGGKK